MGEARVTGLVCPGLFAIDELTVPSGRVAVLLGRSGAGKSTLADFMFGLRGRDAGDAVSLGERGGALLLQKGAVFDDLTVRENVELVIGWNPSPSGVRSVEDYLRDAGLEPTAKLLDQKAATLSGGEKRRLAIARTLPSDPSCYFFDEPSVGLDPRAIRRLALTIRELATERRCAVVVVTHDLFFTAQIADSVWMFEAGQVTQRWTRDASDRPFSETRPAREAAIAVELEDLCFPAEDEPSVDANDEQAAPASPSRGIGAVFREIFVRAGLRGVPFFALIGAVLGTVLMVVLRGATPADFGKVLSVVKGTPLIALTPPLAAFLFISRSGSAVVAWLGNKVFTRQVDAMRTLGIPPSRYLVAPVFGACTLAFLLVSAVFFVLMWLGAATVSWKAFGADNAFVALSPVTVASGELWLAAGKCLVYGLLLALLIVEQSMKTKRESAEVATAITDAIIYGTAVVTAAELLLRLHLLVRGHG